MNSVISRDGTAIAYDVAGSGPAVVLIGGASAERMANAGLAAELARDFTVYNVDRRGRGDSTDTPPYAVEREVEDITAVIEAAGGSAYLLGGSSGAALSLEAAAAGAPVAKLVLWEPPYSVGDARRPPADGAKKLAALTDAGKRAEAVEYFMRDIVGMPEEAMAGIKQSPHWERQLKLAHTLAYDATVMGDYSIPAERFARIAVPTLILDGSASFDIMAPAADELARIIPGAVRATLEGQAHNPDAGVLAPVLRDFFLR
jgi:pimeloyl-ACP methyl ester carboxylesterase